MKYLRYFKNQAEAIDKEAYLPTVAIIKGINKVGYFNANDKTRQYKFTEDGDFIKIGEAKKTEVVCTYITGSTTELIQICNNTTGFTSMEVDGVETTIATGYTFTTTGQHTVKFTLKDSTTIGEEAFKLCDLLYSVVIPDGVTTIGESAFRFCSSITYGMDSVTIPDSVTTIGAYAFSDCYCLMSICYMGTVAQWKAINKGEDWYFGVSASEVTCTDGYCTLDGENIDSSYLICAYSIDTTGTYLIAEYVGDFKAMRVDNVSAPLAGTYNFTTTGIHTIEFLLRDSTKMSTAAFNEMTNSCLVSVTIPDTIKTLAKQLFRRCYKLTHITLSKNITEITEELLNECESLVSLVIPDGVTSIGKHSLNHCYALTSLTIPSSVTYIGPYGLYRTESLSAIHFKGTKAQWNSISKRNNWNTLSKLSTIHCSDGDISL